MTPTHFSTKEVALILHKTDSQIVHACLNNDLKIKRDGHNSRRFTVTDINNLWQILYGKALCVKNVERIGDNFDLRLE